MRRYARTVGWWPAAAISIAGCAVTTADGDRVGLGSDRYRDYVEAVFRDQNRVATELAFALEDGDSGESRAAELAAAERSLLEACAALNELAAARRDGRSLGALREARAARTAPDCERAARAARRRLDAG